MNEKLIYNWNKVVSPDDIVYYLGDFSLVFRPIETITQRLNGKKFLVPGNHDWCHSYHKKGKRDQQAWIKKYEENGWIVLPEQTHIYHVTEDQKRYKLNLCHLPSVLESYDDKYQKWRPTIPKEEILLCGHIHQKWQQKDNCINVGVDVWNYTPVSINQILELIESPEK
jgi:calcineurin-like phosphoesterase family protein